jgi:hypothetical protein
MAHSILRREEAEIGFAVQKVTARVHTQVTRGISPQHDTVGALEFHMLDSLRDAGRRAAIEALENAPARILG